MGTPKENLCLSIREESACERAASLLRDGHPVGSYVRGVCVLWADGQNPAAVDRIYQIKGAQRQGRPFGTTLYAPSFVHMLDETTIPDEMRALFLNAHELVGRLGSLCLIRAPIRAKVAEELPPHLTSQTPDRVSWLQNWLPEGSRPLEVWMAALERYDIRFPAVTSMNVSGQPELVDQEQAVRFCTQYDVPVFLGDPAARSAVRGSFPVIRVDQGGIKLVREGHYPPGLLAHLLAPWKIDLTDYAPAKYPLLHTHSDQEASALSPQQLRREMLELLDA